MFLAKIIDNPNPKQSSILLPDGRYEDAVTYAEVRFVGPGRLTSLGERVSPELKVGDVVIISNLSGVDITVYGEKLLLMAEKFVLAVVPPKN
jgi:chaperonin GroES